MKVSEGTGRKYVNEIEQFIAAFFYQLYTKNAKYISAEEFESLKNEILLKDVGAKDAEERLKKLRTLMQIMVYIGLITKQAPGQGGLSNEEEKSHSKEYSEFLAQSK